MAHFPQDTGGPQDAPRPSPSFYGDPQVLPALLCAALPSSVVLSIPPLTLSSSPLSVISDLIICLCLRMYFMVLLIQLQHLSPEEILAEFFPVKRSESQVEGAAAGGSSRRPRPAGGDSRDRVVTSAARRQAAGGRGGGGRSPLCIFLLTIYLRHSLRNASLSLSFPFFKPSLSLSPLPSPSSFPLFRPPPLSFPLSLCPLAQSLPVHLYLSTSSSFPPSFFTFLLASRTDKL